MGSIANITAQIVLFPFSQVTLPMNVFKGRHFQRDIVL
jgi:hypothetical protein